MSGDVGLIHGHTTISWATYMAIPQSAGPHTWPYHNQLRHSNNSMEMLNIVLCLETWATYMAIPQSAGPHTWPYHNQLGHIHGHTTISLLFIIRCRTGCWGPVITLMFYHTLICLADLQSLRYIFNTAFNLLIVLKPCLSSN